MRSRGGPQRQQPRKRRIPASGLVKSAPRGRLGGMLGRWTRTRMTTNKFDSIPTSSGSAPWSGHLLSAVRGHNRSQAAAGCGRHRRPNRRGADRIGRPCVARPQPARNTHLDIRPMISAVALTVASIWLGSLFLYSGSLKLLSPTEHNVRAIRGYKLLPTSTARIVGLLLPWAELVVGALMLLTPFGRVGAAVAAAFGSVFVIGAGSALVRGIKTDCGCAGKASGRVGRATLARAALIAASGVAVAISGGQSSAIPGWLVAGVAIAPAGAIALQRFLRRGPGRITTNETRRFVGRS